MEIMMMRLNKKAKYLLCSLLLNCLAWPLAGLAQSPTPNNPGVGPDVGTGVGSGMGRGMGRMLPSFQDFDADGDGRLTQTEFEQGRAQRIAERSQQGYPMRGLASAPSFAEMDTNNDGVLNPEEFRTAQARHHSAGARGMGAGTRPPSNAQ